MKTALLSFLLILLLIGNSLLSLQISSLEETIEAVGQRQESWGRYLVEQIGDEAYKNREHMSFLATEIIIPALKPSDQTQPTIEP